MRFFLLFLLISISTGACAEGVNLQRIETRYGTLDVLDRSSSVDIRFQGKVVRSTEVETASLYRITPKGQREFVIVDGWSPALYCHHVFYLVEVYANGEAVASDQFGACRELQGAQVRGEHPLIRLSDPDVLGGHVSSKSTSFEWKNGSIVQVSDEVSEKSPSECAAANDAAEIRSSSIAPDHRAYKVSGKGRLQFLFAPDVSCEEAGVFVIAGDMVIADKHFGAYTSIHYDNLKSGKAVHGWVLSNRLVNVSL